MIGIRRTMRAVESRLDNIWTALVVRDPGTSMSADAYEGLRKQVVAAVSARFAHLGQLAELDAALERGASVDDLKALSRQWLEQAGIQVIRSAEDPRLFDNAAGGEADATIQQPAYVDEATGRLIKAGRLG